MILGMPVESWILLALAVGLGLALELAFYRARRRDPGGRRRGAPTPDDPEDAP